MTKASNTPRATSGKGRIKFVPWTPETAAPNRAAVVRRVGPSLDFDADCIVQFVGDEPSRVFGSRTEANKWATANRVALFETRGEARDWTLENQPAVAKALATA